MSTIQRKPTKKEQQSDSSEVQGQEIIEIPLPQPKKKGSSKQEPVPVVIEDASVSSILETVEKPKTKKENSSSKQESIQIEVEDDSVSSIAEAESFEKSKSSKKGNGSSKQKEQKEQKDSNPNVVDDDSTPSVVVAEPKPSKKGKSSAPKPDEPVESNSVEPAPSKKGKGKQSVSQTETSENDESGVESCEVVEKSKKQPPKPLDEQMTDSVETLKENVEKSKVLIELKDTLQKQISPLISSRKKELKKLKVDDESEDSTLQFLEKQKECLKNEISELKSSIRDLSSVSTVIEKATKQLNSKKKKSDEDPSKPKKPRSQIFVPVSTDSMTKFILQNLDMKSNKGPLIFEQTPERNLDGHLLVETTQLMQLIHAYIRDKSLKKKDCPIELDEQLKPLYSAYLLQKQKEGIANPKLDSTSVMSVVHYHVEKKLKE